MLRKFLQVIGFFSFFNIAGMFGDLRSISEVLAWLGRWFRYLAHVPFDFLSIEITPFNENVLILFALLVGIGFRHSLWQTGPINSVKDLKTAASLSLERERLFNVEDIPPFEFSPKSLIFACSTVFICVFGFFVCVSIAALIKALWSDLIGLFSRYEFAISKTTERIIAFLFMIILAFGGRELKNIGDHIPKLYAKLVMLLATCLAIIRVNFLGIAKTLALFLGVALSSFLLESTIFSQIDEYIQRLPEPPQQNA